MRRLLFLLIFLNVLSLYAGVGRYKSFKKDSYRGSVTSYEIDNKVYFDLNDIAKLFNAGINIYSASGRIIFSISGKKLIIAQSSVSYNNVEERRFSRPAIFRGSRYFILSDIFTDPAFTKIFEVRCDIDRKNKTISLYDNINVTAVKYFYYIEKSRVVIYLSKKLHYDINLAGRTLVVSVKNGSYISSKDYINADDGVIKGVSVMQEKDSLKVMIELGPRYLSFDHSFEEEPYKIIIDLNPLKDEFPPRIEGAEKSTITVNLPDLIDTSKKERYVIVIDPGHGGKDFGGKVIFGKPEKQINLEIAKKLYELFLKDKRFEVKITRDKDEFVPLYERSRYANEVRCDIFISIHCNSHPRKRDENGFEIYFLSEKATDPWASEVAEYENASIQYEGGAFDYTAAAVVLHSIARNEYINQGSLLAGYVAKFMERSTPFKNRGIKQAAFYVLRGTYCPSILVEVGFMTNKKDKKNLDNEGVQRKVAASIYQGVVEYIKGKR